METIERFAEFDANGNLIINNPPPLKNKRVKILIAVIEEETDASGVTTQNIIAEETAFVSSGTGTNPLHKTV